jgi:cell division protein FtsB
MAGCAVFPEESGVVTTRAPKRRSSRFGIAPQAVVLVLILGLVGAMAIEPTRRLLDQRRRIEGMAGDLHHIETLNDRLEARIKRLQDPDYIEQEARAIAGLVYRGERTFVVMPLSRKERRERAETARESRDPEPSPPPEPGLIEGWLDFVGLG